MNPHVYHVSLSDKLWHLKQRLIEEMRRSWSDEGKDKEGRT